MHHPPIASIQIHRHTLTRSNLSKLHKIPPISASVLLSTRSRLQSDSKITGGAMETKAPDDKPTTRDVWMRGLFMLLFIIAFWVGQTLLNLLAVVQFIWLL